VTAAGEAVPLDRAPACHTGGRPFVQARTGSPLPSLQETPMPAYCLFENLEIHDLAQLEAYKSRVGPLVQRHGGRYVVLGGNARRVEGDWAPAYLVMIEFPDLARATQWYESPEYADVKRLRLAAGRFNGVIVEGL
jgi:uncharacterized protein (DUF1330 family)